MKFPVLSSLASPAVVSDADLMFAVQSVPLILDRIRLDVFVMASVAEEGSLTGVARLAIHKTLSAVLVPYTNVAVVFLGRVGRGEETQGKSAIIGDDCASNSERLVGKKAAV